AHRDRRMRRCCSRGSSPRLAHSRASATQAPRSSTATSTLSGNKSTNNQAFSGFIKEPPNEVTAPGRVFYRDAQSEKPSRPGLFTHLTLPRNAEGSPPLRQAVAIQFTAHTGRGRRPCCSPPATWRCRHHHGLVQQS